MSSGILLDMHHEALGDFRLVPQALVPVIRQVLVAQGVDPGIISDNGQVSAMGLVTAAFDRVEVHSNFGTWPIDLRGPSDPNTAKMLELARPSVVLTGRAGRVEIAPYGKPIGLPAEFKTGALKVAIGVVAGGVGLAVLWRLLNPKPSRR